MSLFEGSSTTFDVLTSFDNNVKSYLTTLDNIIDPEDVNLQTSITTSDNRLTELTGYVGDIDDAFISKLDSDHTAMKAKIKTYDVKREELKNNVMIQKTMRARNFESQRKPTYMLFLCWVFIFLLFVGVLLLQLVEIEFKIPFVFHIVFLIAFLVVGYSIVKNIQAFIHSIQR
jgi:uncharacterized membrane protein